MSAFACLVPVPGSPSRGQIRRSRPSGKPGPAGVACYRLLKPPLPLPPARFPFLRSFGPRPGIAAAESPTFDPTRLPPPPAAPATRNAPTKSPLAAPPRWVPGRLANPVGAALEAPNRLKHLMNCPLRRSGCHEVLRALALLGGGVTEVVACDSRWGRTRRLPRQQPGAFSDDVLEMSRPLGRHPRFSV